MKARMRCPRPNPVVWSESGEGFKSLAAEHHNNEYVSGYFAQRLALSGYLHFGAPMLRSR
jgi:hypothetical protein